MDIKEIRDLLKLIDRHGIQDFTLQRGDNKVRIRKGGFLEEPVVVRSREASSAEVQASRPSRGSVSAPQVSPPSEEQLAVGENQFLVTSPIVGTFYRAPSPESPPYVEVGDSVAKGTVLCIIEAMKIMNEIECEVTGKVSSILVENAQPVEYGQALFIIDLV